jgi:uncharacterized protein YfiM (DUF2279 family)
MTIFSLAICVALLGHTEPVCLISNCESLVCVTKEPPPRAPAAIFPARRPTVGERSSLAENPLAASENDPWFGVDKVEHFTMSFFIEGAAYAGLRGAKLEHGASLAGASVATLVAGLGKEFRDRRQGRGFSVRDLAWDVAGGAVGALLVSRAQR